MGILLGGWPSHRPIGLNMVTYKWWVSTTFPIICHDRPMSVIWLGWDSIRHWSALLGDFKVVQHLKEGNLCFCLVPGIESVQLRNQTQQKVLAGSCCWLSCYEGFWVLLLCLLLLLVAVASWAAILSVWGVGAASSCCSCASSSSGFCPGSEASKLHIVL